ncbi:MAG: 3-phosphoshikimate 1-carboxyvinyltransferase [Legionella sp.]|nr:MAG: 3-phosphoshikimate 1-carboxyvinyltransferase [Legionella sp.]
MHYRVQPSVLHGTMVIPPSKSHTLRAILFASLATGTSTIRNYLCSPDTAAMITACRYLGASILEEERVLHIQGCAGKPKTPEQVIDAGNSGQVLRFIAAIAALTEGYTILTGDPSIRTNRPMQPLLDGLRQLQVFAVSAHDNGFAPIIIKGPLQGGVVTVNGEDSQPISGLLMAAAFAQHPTVLHVVQPGEQPWIDVTLNWFDRLGIGYHRKGYTHYEVSGNAQYAGFDYTVPGDFSSCAFPVVAALITHADLELHHIDLQDAQGDKALLFVLQQMGAQLQFDSEKKILAVKPSKFMKGRLIDVNDFIDAVPILAVMACFVAGETVITGAAIARKKESDRLSVITQELRKMGADIIEYDDGLRIRPAILRGAKVMSADDHRIAMALAVAGLRAHGKTIVEHVACVDKSYPNFAKSFCDVGASIEIDT